MNQIFRPRGSHISSLIGRCIAKNENCFNIPLIYLQFNWTFLKETAGMKPNQSEVIFTAQDSNRRYTRSASRKWSDAGFYPFWSSAQMWALPSPRYTAQNPLICPYYRTYSRLVDPERLKRRTSTPVNYTFTSVKISRHQSVTWKKYRSNAVNCCLIQKITRLIIIAVGWKIPACVRVK